MATKQTWQSFIGGDLVDTTKLSPELLKNFHDNGDKLYFTVTDTLPSIGDTVKVTADNVAEIVSNAKIHSAAKLEKRATLLEKYGKVGSTGAKTSKARVALI